MNCYVLAIGEAGARLCEATLYACMAGTLPADRVTLALLCMPEDKKDRLTAMAADYEAVRGAVSGGTGNAMRPEVQTFAWPAANEGASVQLMARSETERLLMRALFTREEAGRDLSDAMGGSGALAALRWADLLGAQGDDLAALLAPVKGTDEVVLCAGLCEAAGAAGVPALTRWLRPRPAFARLSLTALLPVHASDDAGLCRAALRDLREADYRAAVLLGLPEDCLDERSDTASLVDWMAVRAIDGILNGTVGMNTIRLTADGFGWADFGDARDRYRRAWDGLMQAAAVLLSELGPTAADKLISPNWLTDRMGWYGAFFGPARKGTDAEREAMAADLQAAMRLLSAYAQWMRDVLSELPTAMSWTDEMEAAVSECRAHYRKITELAGHLAVMEDDALRINAAEEGFIHRHDNTDTPAEALLKQIAAVKEQLTALEAEQEELDRRIGGRMARALLSETARECAAEADALRTQADEAQALIDRTAETAGIEDAARIETARARMTRLQRHLRMLDGRTDRAWKDHEAASRDEVRTRAPEVENAAPMDSNHLYVPDQLDALGRIAWSDRTEHRKLMQQLEQAWPWVVPLKDMIDETVHAPQASAPTASGRLLCSVINTAMGRKGETKHAETVEQRPGVTA